MSASLPGSFSATGRGLRTGHLCDMDTSMSSPVPSCRTRTIGSWMLYSSWLSVPPWYTCKNHRGGGGGAGRTRNKADFASPPNLDDLAEDARRDHDFMVLHELVLVDLSDDAPANERLALADVVRSVPVLLLRVQRSDIHAQRNEGGLARLVENDLKGSLDTVKDVFHDTRAQFDAEGRLRSKR